MKLRNDKLVFRIVLLGLCLALYVVLSMSFTTIHIGNFLEISFGGLSIVFISVLYGPIDGMLVGLLGEFICQATGEYGLTLITPLWLLPAVLRGLVIGLLFKHKDVKNHKVLWVITNIIAGFVVTGANTLVIHLDAFINEYPSQLEALTVLMRFISSVIMSVIFTIVVPLFFEILKKMNKLTPEEKRLKNEKTH